MAITNFIVTIGAVTAAVLLFRSDLKQSASIFRRNIKYAKQWLEEESSAAAKSGERTAPKELDSKIPKKDIPKDDKSTE